MVNSGVTRITEELVKKVSRMRSTLDGYIEGGHGTFTLVRRRALQLERPSLQSGRVLYDCTNAYGKSTVSVFFYFASDPLSFPDLSKDGNVFADLFGDDNCSCLMTDPEKRGRVPNGVEVTFRKITFVWNSYDKVMKVL